MIRLTFTTYLTVLFIYRFGFKHLNCHGHLNTVKNKRTDLSFEGPLSTYIRKKSAAKLFLRPTFENGIDVKFGLEDLKKEPEQTACWDGVTFTFENCCGLGWHGT